MLGKGIIFKGRAAVFGKDKIWPVSICTVGMRGCLYPAHRKWL